jgi:hypothetical protein
MERAAGDTSTEAAAQAHLEHRWGTRLRCRARVRLSTSTGITGAGRIRDISSSGAFIETAVELPVNTRLNLVVLGNSSATHAVDMAATIVRIDHHGVGVEWCQTPVCSICSAVGCTVRCAHPDSE